MLSFLHGAVPKQIELELPESPGLSSENRSKTVFFGSRAVTLKPVGSRAVTLKGLAQASIFSWLVLPA
jgi:hypothetical protein